ncbi:putative RNA-directed DNA polymerase [Lupinus albus]|uniref:Putative RNA-directed DNA polymerase n=1 Tax=Lupinus albus TaxID=3870 RepID=A0A6A4QPF0_LUPAL|nr:putative RNA-directed DNA polymerase [Lupinus albus]
MPSTNGHRYFLTIVDDKSRFTWIYFMKCKSEVPNLIRKFTALINTQFGIEIKNIRSDNGREFSMNEFYDKHGIQHQTSCVETLQQTGIVERKHQHILGVARSLIFQSNLPHCLWNYALLVMCPFNQ